MENVTKKNKTKSIILIIICILLFVLMIVSFYFAFKKDNTKIESNSINETNNNSSKENNNVSKDNKNDPFYEDRNYNYAISNSIEIDTIGDYKILVRNTYRKYLPHYWYYLVDVKNEKVLASEGDYDDDLAIKIHTDILINYDEFGKDPFYNSSKCKLAKENLDTADKRASNYTKENLSNCDYYIIDFHGIYFFVNKKDNVVSSEYKLDTTKDIKNITLYDNAFIVSNDIGEYEEYKYLYGLLNINTLKEEIKPTFNNLYHLYKNKYVGTINGKQGLYTNNGKELLKPENDIIGITYVNNKPIIFTNNNKEIKIYDENLKDITDTIDKEDVKYSIYSDEYRKVSEIDDFDLHFLKTENKKENKIYSPLSIKYALEMLNEGASGDTKEQISKVLGDYYSGKYVNSSNMALVNALFVRNSEKDSIKSDYKKILQDKYDANITNDSFESPDKINNWISNKTFNLIKDAIKDVTNKSFILINALAINMEWVNKIQSTEDGWGVGFTGANIDFETGFEKYVLDERDIEEPPFARIGAVVNKYDIVNILGKDKLKQTVKKEYQKWLDEGSPDACGDEPKDAETYVKQTITDEYFNNMNKAYKTVSSSTDFEFYDDKDVKLFAKDLKKYNGVTLQYIGIMPKTKSLDKFISDINPSDLNSLIGKLKKIELNNFKEGVITDIYGKIPMFKFDYELDLINDLNKLGITDVFDKEKADLSNLSSNKEYISEAVHKTNIEFSNEGIKAASFTSIGGDGGGGCGGFYYYFKPPVEEIDLTFDKPYMFIIRNKDTKEPWFIGTVYKTTTDMNRDYDPDDYMGN